MNFKSTQILFVTAILGLLTLAGCQKEMEIPAAEISSETREASGSVFNTRLVDITEQYDYYGETFSVTYTLDQETNEIVDARGDVERAEALFTGENAPMGQVVTIGNMDKEAVTRIQLFKTQEEAEAEVGGFEQACKSCVYAELAGDGSFRFYDHAYYAGELIDLTKHNIRGLHWNNVMAHNNDRITSIAADGVEFTKRGSDIDGWFVPRLYIFDDICFSGPATYFMASRETLSSYYENGYRYFRFRYEMRIPNLAAVSVYLGYYQGYSTWNDRISSVKCVWPNIFQSPYTYR